MNVGLFFWDRLPAPTYGGTQRMVMYLARGLAAAGHGSPSSPAKDPTSPRRRSCRSMSSSRAAPPSTYGRTCPPASISCSPTCRCAPPGLPWVRGLPGNWKPGNVGPPNTLYLSEDHARRHGGTAFVYNGIDPADFHFRPAKDDYDLFLGRLHSIKGYRWAIEGAKRTRQPARPRGRMAPSSADT